MLGGYKLIDLKGVTNIIGADSSLPTISGIYDAIESARKRIVVSNLVTSDGETVPTITEYNEIEMTRSISSDDFVLTTATPDGLLTITVNDDDEIAVAVVPYYTAPEAPEEDGDGESEA